MNRTKKTRKKKKKPHDPRTVKEFLGWNGWPSPPAALRARLGQIFQALGPGHVGPRQSFRAGRVRLKGPRAHGHGSKGSKRGGSLKGFVSLAEWMAPKKSKLYIYH